ncbi:NADH dehydrogenase [ubiquinone] 1 beta subcomplex subunit 9 isoform X2 [Bacillus rossius redtenbacheri]|uniref:NADH dehydrogenase [ubiquinone] 1 beta subcomplex subunit 9 isoform X2 n=1 Tax=Bacillus rossius redtenbacheri TaxID=93214 RepID=UPI002FDD0142
MCAHPAIPSEIKWRLECHLGYYPTLKKRLFRYRAILHRQRFEEHRDEKDMRRAAQLLAAGEQELFEKQHYQPLRFPKSPGGTAYQREVIPPDWVLDYWHPLEKAQYPEYFARREERKKQFVEMWEKQYGKPKPDAYDH